MFDTWATLANGRRKNATKNKSHTAIARPRYDPCRRWMTDAVPGPECFITFSTRHWANASILAALAPRLAGLRRRPGRRWRRRRRRLRTGHGRWGRIGRRRTARPNSRRLDNVWRGGGRRRKVVLRWPILRRTGTPLGHSRLNHSRRWRNGLGLRPCVRGWRKGGRAGFNSSAFLTECRRVYRRRLII